MRNKMDPALTREISSRFVTMIEDHLQLPWSQVADLLGYSNTTTLNAIKEGRTLPGPDKFHTLARWTTPEGERPNIDWIFSAQGSPLVGASDAQNKKRRTSSMASELNEIERLPQASRAALAKFLRTLHRTAK